MSAAIVMLPFLEDQLFSRVRHYAASNYAYHLFPDFVKANS